MYGPELMPDTVCVHVRVRVGGRYAVNTSHPGAQIWLDSVYGQYAEWGVDLIKNDCIFAINYEEDNIKGVSAAIAKTGRPTVYSLSPGGGDPPTEFAQAKAIANDVNIYRVTGDWHGGDLSYHFQVRIPSKSSSACCPALP
jgi:hypothetical protein